MTGENLHPHAERVARDLGIPAENLIRGLAVEREFHERILQEGDRERRKEMYRAVYETVHPLYGSGPALAGGRNPKERIVRIFARELSGKSILDVGCGNGLFLRGVDALLPHGELVGLDTSAPVLPGDGKGIRFVRADVTDFRVEGRFDVVWSEHLIEHLAPADLATHLSSIARALREDGVLIICAPNGLFGPSDVTRIVDPSHTGRTRAEGTHLHEPTHGELMELLSGHGFGNFRTIFPLMRLRNHLGFIRFDARVMAAMERNPIIMGLLHAVRRRGSCIARFDTVLICGRG